MKQLEKTGFSILGGVLAGLGLALSPRLGFFSEVRTFQIFLLEMTYQALTQFLPPAAMRFLGTAWGELIILSSLGALMGLGIGLMIYVLAFPKSRQWRLSSFVLSFSLTVGSFVALFGVLWCRIALIHSSNQRMVSPEGLGMVLGSLGIGSLVGVGFLFSLSWLARYRLAKIVLVGFLLVLLVGYLNSSLAGGTIPSVTSQPVTAPPIKQVVLLGGDGATWDVALPMIKEGKLPHLAQLMERGAWGEIRATIPWKSPIIWTSIATGKREKKHGIHDFVVRDPKTHEVIPVSIGSRKVKAIWDIVTEAGLRVDVVNWYVGWPAEPVNGTMVSRLSIPELPDRVFPKERTKEIDSLVQQFEKRGVPRNETMAAAVGLYLLERDRPDLALMYLREIDDSHHLFWKYHALRRGSLLARWLYGPVDKAEIEKNGRKIEEAYEKLDTVLGRILKIVGPETAVVVVSDHGGGIKSPNELSFTLNPLLEKLGLLRYSSGGQKIDWSETKLYDATKRPWYEERELFINRRPEGPFGQGLSDEAERKFLGEVVERLKELKTVSGKSVMTKTWIQESGDETKHVVARVNVRLNEKEMIRVENAGLPLSKIVWRTNLTGTHRLNGILVMAGPGIKSGYRLRAASVLDITPTLLYLMNLSTADDMEGRVLLEAMEPNVRKTHPVQMISSYETGKVRTRASSQKSAADEELLDQLRSLGYIQ